MNIGVGDAVKLVSLIGNLLKDGMTLEAQEKIIELRKKIVEIESAYLDMQEENKNLRTALDRKENLKFENGVYWKIDEVGDSMGPFCAKCHDKEGKLCRMIKDKYYYVCVSCDMAVEHTEIPVQQRLPRML